MAGALHPSFRMRNGIGKEMSSGNEGGFWIPQTLDDPKLFFMWEIDSAYLAIGAALFALLFQSLIVALAGAFVVYGYARLKEEGGKGTLIRLLYWYLPSSWLTEDMQSHNREFIGR